MVESVDKENPISKLSPFAIAKAIEGIAGEPREIKRTRDGLLIEVARKAHALNLLKATMFAHVPIKVTPHKSMNSRKGVIRCNSLEDETEDDICFELKDQNVTEVKRIFKDKGTTPTNTFILTFGVTTLPEAVKIGYMRVRVSPYVPFPLRCFKCQKYGHGKNRCRGKDICSKCGGNHKIEDCISSTKFCVNCEGEHEASDKNCPEFVTQKEILRIKYNENISFPEARRRVELQKPQKVSYAQTLAGSIPSTPRVKTASIEVQTFLTWSVSEKAFKWLGCSPEAQEMPLQLVIQKPLSEKESIDTSKSFMIEQESGQHTIDTGRNVEKQDTGGGAGRPPTADAPGGASGEASGGASGGAPGGARQRTHQTPRYANTGIPKPNKKHKNVINRSPISAP